MERLTMYDGCAHDVCRPSANVFIFREGQMSCATDIQNEEMEEMEEGEIRSVGEVDTDMDPGEPRTGADAEEEPLVMENYVRYARILKQEDRQTFEKLERTGDAVVRLIVDLFLNHKYPEETVGFISKNSDKLLNQSTQAHFAKLLGFDEKDHSNKQLCDYFEVMMGIMFEHRGYRFMEKYLYKFFEQEAHKVDQYLGHKNFTSELNMFCQQQLQVLPQVDQTITELPNNAKMIFVKVTIVHSSGTYITQAGGKNAKVARQNASKLMLEKLTGNSYSSERTINAETVNAQPTTPVDSNSNNSFSTCIAKLNLLSQQNRVSNLEYHDCGPQGPPHQILHNFAVKCVVHAPDGQQLIKAATGTGMKKREAKGHAAHNLLQQIEQLFY